MQIENKLKEKILNLWQHRIAHKISSLPFTRKTILISSDFSVCYNKGHPFCLFENVILVLLSYTQLRWLLHSFHSAHPQLPNEHIDAFSLFKFIALKHHVLWDRFQNTKTLNFSLQYKMLILPSQFLVLFRELHLWPQTHLKWLENVIGAVEEMKLLEVK